MIWVFLFIILIAVSYAKYFASKNNNLNLDLYIDKFE